MKAQRNLFRNLSAALRNSAAVFALLAGATVTAQSQCPAPVFASGLRAPTKIIVSQKGNLLVAEQGTATPNTGRVSIVDPNSGAVRSLIDGLPSALNLVGGEPAPSGPDGLALRGRTLYLTIGSGNTTLPGPFPGVEKPNPAVSSPLFSSVLELHFNAQMEMTAGGFKLTLADQRALQNGATVTLANGHGGKITVKLVTNFPDYVPASVPGYVVSSNAFGLVLRGDDLFVVDASLNLLAKVDTHTGETSTLTTFANVRNTLPSGPPTVQAVPNSIHWFGDDLLVTYLSGFPFGPGAAQVRIVEAENGQNQPFIRNLTAAIDVLPIWENENTRGGDDNVCGDESRFLVLEFGGVGLSQPGRLLLFSAANARPTVVSDCLVTPTSLARKGNAIFVTEIGTGNLIKLNVP